MTEDDRPQFLAMMNRLGATYRLPLTPILLESYWEALDDLDVDAVSLAVKQAIRESPHCPRPADLRAIAQPPRRGYQPGDGLWTPMPDFDPDRHKLLRYDRPPMESPEHIATLVSAAARQLEEKVAAKQPKPMTQEEIDARKATLREQAKKLT